MIPQLVASLIGTVYSAEHLSIASTETIGIVHCVVGGQMIILADQLASLPDMTGEQN